MKQILSFFAGILLVILTAATTGITEVKPAQSKNLFIEKYIDYEKARNIVFQKRKEGWILKEFDYELYGSNGWVEISVVMEKY